MNGKPLPVEGREMKAFVAYIHFLSTGIPVGERVRGQGMARFQAPARAADPVRGQRVYAAKCVQCHGADGAGKRIVESDSGQGYLYPPLWGPDSFNNGAGMARLLTAAAFIRVNMPQGATVEKPQVTDDEAYDVAAFVLDQPRPEKAYLELDYPARCKKPVDAAFPPYVDHAPALQHKFGPFQPIQEDMNRLCN